MTKKLTEPQLKVLRMMGDCAVLEYWGLHCLSRDGHSDKGIRSDTVTALERLGLIEVVWKKGWRWCYALTPKGRAALEKENEP